MELSKAIEICSSITLDEVLERAIQADESDPSAIHELNQAIVTIFNSYTGHDAGFRRKVYSIVPVFGWAMWWKLILKDDAYRHNRISCAYDILTRFLKHEPDVHLTDVKSNITLLALLKDSTFDLDMVDNLWWQTKLASYDPICSS